MSSAALVLVVAIPLSVLSIHFVGETRLRGQVQSAVVAELVTRPGSQLVDIAILGDTPDLHLLVTIRSPIALDLAEASSLQEALAVRLQLPLLLELVVIPTTRLSPKLPPTLTPTSISGSGVMPARTPRTEGWIAGLQMAAISMQGITDTAGFIQSFTGSHHFVLDYLIEEVLQRQPESIQAFLLRTSILDRMCGPLCDAVLDSSLGFGQVTLEYDEHANLFMISLDNERHWCRYHQLFAELLHQRLGQILSPGEVTQLQLRASDWYEKNDLMFEAFRHATAANEVERAVRLMESRKMPLHRRGTVTTILDWLEGLPEPVRNARPVLCSSSVKPISRMTPSRSNPLFPYG